MATIRAGFTASYIDESTEAVHNLDSDTLKMALYDDNAVLGLATTAYSATDEIAGTGYSAGGATVALASGYPAQDAATGAKSYRFDTITWSGASFSARAGLLYNASKSNKAICVLDFGGLRTVAASTFSIAFPNSLPPIITVRG